MPMKTPFDTAFALLEKAVAKGPIPGGVLGLVTATGQRWTRATGQAQTTPSTRKMHTETWFDLASLTKVIFTTERILDHAALGHIDLDGPLISVIPDLHQYDMGSWQRQVTFRQCLGHQTPYPAVEPIYTYGDDPDRLRAFVLQRNWRKGPPVYSDINFILLGIALERLENRPIRQMDPGPGFSFAPDPALCAATEACSWRGRVICGEVHDENCFALQGSGHAGLFGPVDAVLDFAQNLLARNVKGDDHTKLLRTPLSPTRAHGWESAHNGWHGGDNCSLETIGHTGFTGTGLWIDFARGHAWTLLTNRVHPTRHADSGILNLRGTIGDAVNQKDA